MFGIANPTPATPQSPADLIMDGTEATFMKDVIETSKTVPVIVDFWAPWCGPCKTLTPALEAAVTAAKGRVKLVKIDVDRAPNLSQQLRIQSIPTVYAFWQGQPVDGFQGAVPGSEIKKFIDKLAELGGVDNGLADALAAAEEMLAEGAAADAAETFAAILAEEPENAAAYGGLIRTHLAIDDLDRAQALADIEWLSCTQTMSSPAAASRAALNVSLNQPRSSPKRAGVRISTSGKSVGSIFIAAVFRTYARFAKGFVHSPPWPLPVSRAYRGIRSKP